MNNYNHSLKSFEIQNVQRTTLVFLEGWIFRISLYFNIKTSVILCVVQFPVWNAKTQEQKQKNFFCGNSRNLPNQFNKLTHNFVVFAILNFFLFVAFEFFVFLWISLMSDSRFIYWTCLEREFKFVTSKQQVRQQS